MSAEITGAHHPLSKVFSNDFAFTIPFYQRRYTWTVEHTTDLLDDLTTALGDGGSEVKELPQYFLGSIVVVHEAEGTPNVEVVDGQQRLMTLTILLAALRETLEGKQQQDLQEFIYAPENVWAGRRGQYRLEVRQGDRELFTRHVQTPGHMADLETVDEGNLTDSQVNIRRNALLCMQKVRDMREEQRFRLLEFIIHRCVVVVVSSRDRTSAYRIFTVLNDRGLNLSHCDILKGEIIPQLPEDDQETYARRWEETENDLGREAFEDLFAHIVMIYRKSKSRKSILEEFRTEVMPQQRTPQEIVDKVICPFAATFSKILDTAYESTEHAADINHLLRILRRIDNADWIPPALKYLTENAGNPEDVLRFLCDLERLAASMMLRRKYRQPRVARHGTLLSRMEAGEDLWADDSPLQLSYDEMRETIHALSGPIYKVPRVPLYVLLRLDELLSDGTATYSFNKISVEHVLPQNPPHDSAWLELFPDEQQREELMHKVGNLVILGRRKNSQAANYDFDTKKNTYFATGDGGASPFPITSQVIGEDGWTPDVLERRQTKLIDTLTHIWRLK